jgi:hypothetical protein
MGAKQTSDEPAKFGNRLLAAVHQNDGSGSETAIKWGARIS